MTTTELIQELHARRAAGHFTAEAWDAIAPCIEEMKRLEAALHEAIRRGREVVGGGGAGEARAFSPADHVVKWTTFRQGS